MYEERKGPKSEKQAQARSTSSSSSASDIKQHPPHSPMCCGLRENGRGLSSRHIWSEQLSAIASVSIDGSTVRASFHSSTIIILHHPMVYLTYTPMLCPVEKTEEEIDRRPCAIKAGCPSPFAALKFTAPASSCIDILETAEDIAPTPLMAGAVLQRPSYL